MIKIDFYKIGGIPKEKMDFVVIMAKYNDKWIVVRHKERLTWEIPGGHIEFQEEIEKAASRELFEETGAKDFSLKPISVYSVDNGERQTFGQLYYAEVKELGELPNSEIAEIDIVHELPVELTYPMIQPYLSKRVLEFLIYKQV